MLSGLALRETKPARCAAILVYCSVRDWERFCYIIGFENIRIHRPHVIAFGIFLQVPEHKLDKTKEIKDRKQNNFK